MGTINDYAYFHNKFQGYQISDQDIDSVDSEIFYYGYVNRAGDWYIMKEDTSVSGDANVKSWRFAKGDIDDDYTTQWAARESQTYADFEDTFK